ncbi:MAG: fasciclin domain-containing protein, partial [Microvirga sp.]
LVDTLQTAGPFTVFAPTNQAFAKLPAGTVETLVQPASKEKLSAILTYHVVPGRYTARDLMALIKQGRGQTQLKTVQGETLTLMPGQSGKALFVSDMKGNEARITTADVMQSNGVIHVIDTVVMP